MATTANSQTAAQILAGGKNAGGEALSAKQQESLKKQAAQQPIATPAKTITPTTTTPVATAVKSATVTPSVPTKVETSKNLATTQATPPPTNSTQPGAPAASPAVDSNNPLSDSPEYQIQQALNKPVLDYYQNQKMIEGQKLVDMQNLLDSQSAQDTLMVNDQLRSIQTSTTDNLTLIQQQKEAELALQDETRKTRTSDAVQAREDASLEFDRAIQEQQTNVLQQEAQARTSLGLTGGFGSQARIDTISTAVQKGNDMVSKLQIAKAKLSTDFGKQVDSIERDYSKGVQDVMFNYDKALISLKKDASDQIMAVKKQALLTKQQKDEQYLKVKDEFFDKLSAIEGQTATLMAQTNKDTYSSIIQAHKDELERAQKEQENQWNRATKLIDMYGGVNGAVLAEKMLGLDEGTLPRMQTTDEVKQQLEFMQFQSDQMYKMAGLEMDRQKLKLQQDQFAWDTGEYVPGSYDQYSTAPNGGTIGSKALDTDWSKVSSTLRGNCVLFARSVVPDFPSVGVSNTSKKVNADGKRKAINSKVPVPGSIAIMPERGFYGHVAYVESVNDDGTIVLVDANDPSGNGVIGSVQTLAAGGKGVGGVPGVRRKVVDPKKNQIEGYYVGKGAMTEPNNNPNYDKSELLNGQNDTQKYEQVNAGVRALTNLGGMLGKYGAPLKVLGNAFDSTLGTQPAGQPNLNNMMPSNSQNAGQMTAKDAELAAIRSGAIKAGDLQSKEMRRLKNSDPQGYIDQLNAMSEGVSGKNASKDFTQANQLYNRYDATGKEIRTLDQGFAVTNNFNINTKNPYDDQALIFSFMKVLDPGSVVREGEFKTAQNNASLLQSIGANWQNAVNGQGMLLPAQRQKILDTMKQIYQQKMIQYSDLTNQYAAAGAKLGFDDPSMFLDYTPDYFKQKMAGGSSGSTVKVKGPDGKLYLMSQADAQQALSEGGKIVN